MSAKNTLKSAPKPPFSEDVMRLALARLASVAHHIEGNADDDDPVAILAGVIAENLELRQFKEEVRMFAQTLSTQFTRG